MKLFASPRFSLCILLLAVTVLGVVTLLMYVHLEKREIRGIVRSFDLMDPLWNAMPPPHDQHCREFRHTLVRRLKSRELIAEVISDPRVAILPVLKEKADPVAWLQNNLDISCPGDSEILLIVLRQNRHREDASQGIALVDALIDHCEANWGGHIPYKLRKALPAPYCCGVVSVVERATIVTK